MVSQTDGDVQPRAWLYGHDPGPRSIPHTAYAVQQGFDRHQPDLLIYMRSSRPDDNQASSLCGDTSIRAFNALL